MRYITTFSMLWFNCTLLLAQDQAGDIIQRLEAAGFENIRVHTQGRTLILSYENNLYRNKVNALSEVLDKLVSSTYDTLKIVTLVNDLPIIVTQISTDIWKQHKSEGIISSETVRQLKLTYKTDETWKTLLNEMPVNSHVNKVNLVFYPQFFLMNIRLDQIYEIQLNIAPALEVSLWRGMKFTGQVILPIISDFWYGMEGERVRAGFFTLAQEFRIPGNIFGRAVVGKFNAGRYGADLSLTHYLFGGNCYLKANAGYTGEYLYYDKNWLRNEIKTLTWSLKGGYFYKPQNVQLDGSIGRYINGDYGVRGDCTRYWGETAVGFFAMVADGKLNGGFHFTIPIGSKRLKKDRNFLLRASRYFNWEYNAGTEFYYGQSYKTQPNENRVEHFYNPNLLINNLLK